MKREKGITLIALVITVIILLILAAVAVSMITGNDGLFSKANEAGTLYNEKAKQEADEIKNLMIFANEVSENLEKGPTIKEPEYIQDGLILYLDGIKNTSDGHSDTTTTWYDLSQSGKNATMYGITINEDNMYLSGTSSSYMTLPEDAFGDYTESTFEVVINALNKSTLLVDNNTISHRGIFLRPTDVSVSVGGTGSSCVDAHVLKPAKDVYGRHSYTLIFDGINLNNTTGYQDNVPMEKTTTNDCTSNVSTYPVIGRRILSGYDTWSYKGSIYAIRIYNRALTPEEIQHNYEIDQQRFGI